MYLLLYLIQWSDYRGGSAEACCVCSSKQWENTLGGMSTAWSYSSFTLFIVGFFSELFCFLWLKLKNVNRWIWSLQTSAACVRMVIFVCYILTHEHQTREMQFHQAEAAQPWQSSKKWEQQRTNNLFFFFFFPPLVFSSRSYCDLLDFIVIQPTALQLYWVN